MSTEIVQKSRGMQFIDSVFTPDRMEIVVQACTGNRYATREKILATMAEAAMRTPDIMDAYPPSVFQSALLVCRLDLDASGHHNGAAFVVRWNSKERRQECSVQFGYGALTDLATRDGRIRSFTMGAAYASDAFHFELGTKPYISHTPNGDYGEKELPIWFYAIARFPDGGTEFEVMSLSQVEHIRDKFATSSKGYTSPAWRESFAEQGKKTVLRRLIKRLPVNPVLAEAIHEGDLADGYRFQRDPKPVPTLETKIGNDETTDEPELELIDEEPERDPDTNEIIPAHIGKRDELFSGEGE